MENLKSNPNSHLTAKERELLSFPAKILFNQNLLVDDVLDLEGSSDFMGKPAFGDLKAGLATAPVLFALEEYGDSLLPLVERKFKE